MNNKVLFVGNAVKWFDKVNGNTYHSVKITRVKDGKELYCEFQYGYGESYRDTALTAITENNWLPKKYTKENNYLYERENNYPILWEVSDGLKRECKENGQA